MRVYVVGAPESFYRLASNSFLKTIVGMTPRIFTRAEITANLQSLPEIRLFTVPEEADDYARTLRVCRASHIADPSRKKIAPVIHLDLADGQASKYINHPVISEKISYVVYEGAHRNFAAKNENGGERMQTADVNYRVIAAKDFDYRDFTVVLAHQPDSGNAIQLFIGDDMQNNQPKTNCTLI